MVNLGNCNCNPNQRSTGSKSPITNLHFTIDGRIRDIKLSEEILAFLSNLHEDAIEPFLNNVLLNSISKQKPIEEPEINIIQDGKLVAPLIEEETSNVVHRFKSRSST